MSNASLQTEEASMVEGCKQTQLRTHLCFQCKKFCNYFSVTFIFDNLSSHAYNRLNLCYWWWSVIMHWISACIKTCFYVFCMCLSKPLVSISYIMFSWVLGFCAWIICSHSRTYALTSCLNLKLPVQSTLAYSSWFQFFLSPQQIPISKMDMHFKVSFHHIFCIIFLPCQSLSP